MGNRHAFMQYYSMVAVRDIGWDWHRDLFLSEARRNALSEGYSPPPDGDPALDLTYWRWTSEDGVVQVAADGHPDWVRVILRWDGPGDG